MKQYSTLFSAQACFKLQILEVCDTVQHLCVYVWVGGWVGVGVGVGVCVCETPQQDLFCLHVAQAFSRFVRCAAKSDTVEQIKIYDVRETSNMLCTSLFVGR